MEKYFGILRDWVTNMAPPKDDDPIVGSWTDETTAVPTGDPSTAFSGFRLDFTNFGDM